MDSIENIWYDSLKKTTKYSLTYDEIVGFYNIMQIIIAINKLLTNKTRSN